HQQSQPFPDRPHLSLAKDAPEPRPIQPVEMGRVVAVPRSVDFTTATNDEPPEPCPSSLLMVPNKRRSRSALRPCAALNSCNASTGSLRPNKFRSLLPALTLLQQDRIFDRAELQQAGRWSDIAVRASFL